jgi:hypothetical protein
MSRFVMANIGCFKRRIGHTLSPAPAQEGIMKSHIVKIGRQFTELLEEGKPKESTMDTRAMLALAAMLVVFAILAAVVP